MSTHPARVRHDRAGGGAHRMRLWLIAAVFALAVAGSSRAPGLAVGAGLPPRLSDAEFWSIVKDFSEPDGFFRSENLVSNEDTFQFVIPELQRVVKPGGVYVGVGPDQNFTYIAALKPAVAFIPDVRRGNLDMHLMYKALMELSADRAGFLSRLFSRPLPDGLSARSTADELFTAFVAVPPSPDVFDRTLQAVLARLRRHDFAIEDADEAGIRYILSSFYSAGPYLSYSSSPAGRSRYPTFAELQMATDTAGAARGYLATEDNYRFVRAMQLNNLIVPLIANFAGPKTLRAIGAWVKERDGIVTTFYTSNVEQYLFQDRVWNAFAENLARLPVNDTSLLIRSCFNSCINPIVNSRVVMLLDSLEGLVRDQQAGLVGTYYELLARRR